MNPLFPDDPNNDRLEQAGFTLPQNSASAQSQTPANMPGTNQAADLIREKLSKIYAGEPDAKKEAAESVVVPSRSKHQEFMYNLSTSGKGLAEIQTQWHNYYVALPDEEKHQVWQEFYVNNERTKVAQTSQKQQLQQSSENIQSSNGIVVANHTPAAPIIARPRRLKRPDLRNPIEIKEAILQHVSASGKLSGKHHLQSLLFGIGSGLVVVTIFLFGFFNEVIIAPFIQPNRTAVATPIIVNPDSVTANNTPQIIIPKINVQIPVDYSQTTTNETAIEAGLLNGIVHYPTTKKPGENGNAAFFGHSSNNIFNKGKYKFAFVLLHELVPGDTFYITSEGKTYIYKVTSKAIVKPTDVFVLDDVPGKTATATLITCDPPGTSLNRLIVIGEQISPDPAGNIASVNSSSADNTTATTKTVLPGNGPTLWTRMWRSIF